MLDDEVVGEAEHCCDYVWRGVRMKEDDGGKIILGDMRILLLFFFPGMPNSLKSNGADANSLVVCKHNYAYKL